MRRQTGAARVMCEHGCDRHLVIAPRPWRSRTRSVPPKEWRRSRRRRTGFA